MDATSVSFRKELSSWASIDFLKENAVSLKNNRSRKSERTFLSKKLQSQISSIIKHGLVKLNVPDTLQVIAQECACLIPLLKVILENAVEKDDRLFVSDIWHDFLQSLASSYPVCSFVTTSPLVHEAMRQVCLKDVTKDENTLSLIQHNVPVIFNLIKSLKNKFPMEEMRPVFDVLIVKSLAPFKLTQEILNDKDLECEETSYFPSLTIKRGRGVYVTDKQFLRNECSKLAKGHSFLLPGVFTLFCKHGVCYGFEEMRFHESPNVPFTILRRRCFQAPSLVVYDNACNLHNYCLNRDALFFKNTVFRVDALHFKNHKACGPSYNLKAYPQHKNLNSQVVEQSNARLQRIKSQLSYMTQENFMKHCKLFLWGQNLKVVEKL